MKRVGKVIRGSKVLIRGLTYKEDVPDIRESPVREIVRELNAYKIEVFSSDPLLSDEVIEQFGVRSLPGLDQKMDAAIIAAGHQEFQDMGIQEFRYLMNDRPVLVDAPGIVDRREAEEMGMYYQRLLFLLSLNTYLAI